MSTRNYIKVPLKRMAICTRLSVFSTLDVHRHSCFSSLVPHTLYSGLALYHTPPSVSLVDSSPLRLGVVNSVLTPIHQTAEHWSPHFQAACSSLTLPMSLKFHRYFATLPVDNSIQKPGFQHPYLETPVKPTRCRRFCRVLPRCYFLQQTFLGLSSV
jgi:hypothetical protein